MATSAPRRRYDSAGRRARADESRARVLAAARRLFEERGYARTSVAQIAREAGVSGPTVFAGFSSKANLLRLAVETAVVGDAAPVPLAERPALRRALTADTLDELLRRLVDALAEVAERAGPIVLAARSAAGADPEIAAVVAVLDEQRLAGAARYAAAIADRLGRGGDAAAVAWLRDGLWTLISPQVWELLVRERGCGPQAYRDWLVRALRGLCAEVPH